MGLDFVELMLEIEDEFDVALVDTELNHAETTFGDVVNVVYQKITTKTYDTNDYETTVLKLRKELKKLVPELQNFDENTPLNSQIPFWQRYKVFNSLQISFPMLPDFFVPDIITLIKIDLILFLLAVVSLGLFIIVRLTMLVPEAEQMFFACLTFSTTAVWGVFLLILLVAMLLTAFPSLLQKGFRRMSISDWARMLVEKTDRLERMTKQECEETLRNIFCKTLNLKPEKITLESKLAKDLAIG
jgi:acyl carrier protein